MSGNEPGCGDGRSERTGWSRAVPIGLLFSLLGCSCSSKPGNDVLRALAEERWCLASTWKSKASPGASPEDWIVVFRFPGKETSRLVPGEVPPPDGLDPDRVYRVAYNQAAELLVCLGHRTGKAESFWEVWIRDIPRSESFWVGRKWEGVGRFAWSPDGTKIAFMAARTPNRVEPQRADVYVYDVVSRKLAVVADDGMIAWKCWRSPVWSEDGKGLYYASIGRYIMRVNADGTGKARLPITAVAVLAVRGNEIVYVCPGEIKRSWYGVESILSKTELVMKVTLGERPEGDASRLYEAVWIWQVVVSPSRRFVLLFERTGYYSGRSVLVDTETCKAYTSVSALFPDMDYFEWKLFPCFSERTAASRE